MAVVDFAELKALVPDGRLMALDVGSKTIGVATSDALRMLATPLTTLKRGKLAADLAALAELAKKHEIKALAIGLPLNMDGTEGPRCQSVRQFAANIANHGPPALAALPVVWQDERLSTAAVTRGMIDDYDMSRAKRAERVDAAAAAWILESALARLRCLGLCLGARHARGKAARTLIHRKMICHRRARRGSPLRALVARSQR